GNLPCGTTAVTYPNGHLVEHAFNAQGNVVQRREQLSGQAPSGAATMEYLVARYAYNSEGMLAREERPDGAAVSYLYEVDRYEEVNGSGTADYATAEDRLRFGNLLRRSETARAGVGETRQLVTTWSYAPGSSRVERQRGPYYADPTG